MSKRRGRAHGFHIDLDLALSLPIQVGSHRRHAADLNQKMSEISPSHLVPPPSHHVSRCFQQTCWMYRQQSKKANNIQHPTISSVSNSNIIQQPTPSPPHPTYSNTEPRAMAMPRCNFRLSGRRKQSIASCARHGSSWKQLKYGQCLSRNQLSCHNIHLGSSIFSSMH